MPGRRARWPAPAGRAGQQFAQQVVFPGGAGRDAGIGEHEQDLAECELLQDRHARGRRAAREQARWAGGDQRPGRACETGQFGQQGLALGPAVPRAVGATAFVERLGDHLAAVGGYDRTAQGQLPVPVCLAVRRAGGMGGPAVEHHRCSTGQGASASSGRVACQERRQVICGPPGRVRPPAGAGSRHLFSILSVRLMGRAGQADREPGRHDGAGRRWYPDSAVGFKCVLLSAVCRFPGTQQHGQDSLGRSRGQLRFGGAEGHLDLPGMACLAGRHIDRQQRVIRGAGSFGRGGRGPAGSGLRSRGKPVRGPATTDAPLRSPRQVRPPPGQRRRPATQGCRPGERKKEERPHG